MLVGERRHWGFIMAGSGQGLTLKVQTVSHYIRPHIMEATMAVGNLGLAIGSEAR